jgi:hypothetical protein
MISAANVGLTRKRLVSLALSRVVKPPLFAKRTASEDEPSVWVEAGDKVTPDARVDHAEGVSNPRIASLSGAAVSAISACSFDSDSIAGYGSFDPHPMEAAARTPGTRTRIA